MKMDTVNEKNTVQNSPLMSEPQGVLFAQMPNPNITVGVVTDSEPSSLSLLAAGVAGMAARRARRERLKQLK